MSHFLLILLLYSYLESFECYDSCLHYRSTCLRNETCNHHLKRFQTTCGYELNVCSGTSPSDCVYHLHRIRDTFPTKTCTCYEAIGFSEECDFFRQIIWNHPCERKLKDVGEEIKISHRKLMQIKPKPAEILSENVPKPVFGGGEKRRTTRTPVADQIHQWKRQLSGDLTKSTILQKTCDAALYQVCLKHVSCAQLWSMFRKNCDVDQDNQCRMVDREVCWQSFEGLTWSGLGDCQCTSSNSSDCHWIRLHTNYNKCIYEISKSGRFPVLQTLAQRTREDRENEQRMMSEQYQRRYENRQQNELILREVPTTTSTTTTTTTTTPRPTTTTTTTTTTIPPPTRSPPPPRAPPATTVPPWWSQPATQLPRHRDTSYRQNNFRLKAVIDPPTTTMGYAWQEYQGPKKETPEMFKPKRTSARSSCPDAIRRCESVDECRWHLGELRVRCSATATCKREECAASLQRFSMYVPFALVESIMFCHCAPEDENCLMQQEMIYPKCLYKSSGFMQTCTQSVQKCDQDTRCKHIRHALQAHCPVKNGECARSSLDDCRRTILSARASILEQPCFCKLSDVQCLAHQNTMIPTNPCIENAMIEYSRIMGYNKPGLATNRVTSTVDEVEGRNKDEQEEDEEEDEPIRRTASTISHIPITTVTFAPAVAPKTTYRPYQQQNNRKRMRTTTTTTTRAPMTTSAPTVIRTTKTTKTTTTTTTTTTMSPPMVTSKKSSFLDLFGIFGKKETANVDLEQKIIKPEQLENSEKEQINEEEMMIKKSHDSPKKTKFRTTVTPPITSEAPPPWISTTPTVPTTTTVFTTHAPPPMEGCNTKDANGREIFTHIGAIMRKYVDWSGRCSTWCECESEDHLACAAMPCLDHGTCDAPLTTIEFGERVFLKDRGACYCETGNFVCEFAEEAPEMYPGLYMSIGYSQKDVELIRKAVPREILDKAGFSSSDASTDIASRMQIAFERILPKNLQCRIVTMNELSEPGNALYRIEWYGRNEMFNHTRTKWHSDGAEKICSPYVRKLADHFSLNESPRFQLVLSTVKQVKVLDYLDGLPQSGAAGGQKLYFAGFFKFHHIFLIIMLSFLAF
ncbi:hypothetical protein L5515_012646 [Caenorhabditis briggsae]|uniref:GDNF/GAS1 domain-containing protein n=2 Tax=Caenorhabditis briggsae TaxID=6238 RepID=A0AAE9EY77_CAEBR|nr:hypothetical protein L5515_012646 [Caenorhabditis briggsae]